MRSQHLRRALGSDRRADTGLDMDAETPAKDGEVKSGLGDRFIVCVLLALLSAFL